MAGRANSSGGSGSQGGGSNPQVILELVLLGVTVGTAAWNLGVKICDDIGERIRKRQQGGNPNTDEPPPSV